MSSAVNERSVSQDHSELFHYTSLKGLEGMLESRTLWATEIKSLNDASEFKLLVQKVQSFCDNHMKRDPNAEDVQKLLKDLYAENVQKLLTFTRDWFLRHGIFVACFTAHMEEYDRQNGLLSQWRGYGEDGVAVVFNTKKLEAQLKQEPCGLHRTCCSFGSVIYDDGADLEEIFPELASAMKDVLNHMPDKISEVLNPVNGEVLKEDIDNLNIKLLEFAPYLKHKGFKEENEYRMVFGVFSLEKINPEDQYIFQKYPKDSEDICKEICFRRGERGSIRYIQLFDQTKDPLPISRILVGPSLNQEANEATVKNMLKRLKLEDHIALEKSSIPFVSTA